jgi:hypothetical protein
VIQQTLAHPELLPSSFSFCTNFSDERHYLTIAPLLLRVKSNLNFV